MPRTPKAAPLTRALEALAKEDARRPGKRQRVITPELDAALAYLVRWGIVPDRGAALVYLAKPMAREVVRKVREIDSGPRRRAK
jgi:hypothetical protein